MEFDEPFFQLSADDLIDRLLAAPAAMRAGIDPAAFAEGRAVELRLPDPRTWMTPSGKIELRNPALDEPLPRWLPSYADAEPLPFRLATAPAVQALNSSFQEREELRARQKGMRLLMNPGDAAARGLRPGDRVRVFNGLGEAVFLLDPTPRVPQGLVVAEGIFWLEHAPGSRTVNALTSQRLTDIGEGSTFYDNRVDVEREA
jgi:anaerobic selenocysteine-containing dehydrogenase